MDLEKLSPEIKAYIQSQIQNETDKLHALLIKERTQSDIKFESLQNEYDILNEKYQLLLLSKWKKGPESYSPGQGFLFEEESVEEDTTEEAEEEIVVPAHKRKKKGRKPIDPNIPRTEIIHDIPEEDKICACGHHLQEIGHEDSEKVRVIPEKIIVEKHIHKKYACKNCEGLEDPDKPVVRQAKTEPNIIPRGIATPELLAFIFVSKFLDHLPYYRQEKRFERIGIYISRQDMSNWQQKVFLAMGELLELLKKTMLSSEVMQMDETTVQVMKEEGKKDQANSYMWLSRGGPPGKKVILYEYQPTRASKYISNILDGYEGYVQSDGYKGYDTALADREKITQVGCWAHARRKFYEASKTSKKALSAIQGLNIIKELYKLESKLRNEALPDQEFLAKRKELVKPILDKLKKYLDKKALTILPSSAMGKATSYTLGQWDKLVKYLEHHELTPDNNAAENAIRPFVVGRKNWLFSGSPKGAKSSCALYTMIQTAHDHGLNPYLYLTHIFRELPKGTEAQDLLPWNLDKKQFEGPWVG